MGDSTSTQAERDGQLKFRIAELFPPFLLLVSIGLFDFWLGLLPNREEIGPRQAEVRFETVQFDPQAFGPFRLAGAWRLSSDDPRIGGISALAVEQGRLLALSDAGALVRFGPPLSPIGIAQVGELPDGPGSGRFKRNRDSEALSRDPAGRGWWVAFENRHGLWLYDSKFERSVEHAGLRRFGWSRNKGIEGVATDGERLLLLPEAGDRLLVKSGWRLDELPIANARGRIADAAAIRPGLAIAVERRLTLLGFANSLVLLERAGTGYRFGRRLRLPLGPLDNVEAIAVDPRPDGRLRIWLMTDDNFQPPMRSLLVALDLPARKGTQSE